MITLYGFGRIFPEGRGETKDLWAQWALEETGLPYRVHALDHTGGELDSDAFGRLSPFRQAPVIDQELCTAVLWVCIAPLGLAVVPEVNSSVAGPWTACC